MTIYAWKSTSIKDVETIEKGMWSFQNMCPILLLSTLKQKNMFKSLKTTSLHQVNYRQFTITWLLIIHLNCLNYSLIKLFFLFCWVWRIKKKLHLPWKSLSKYQREPLEIVLFQPRHWSRKPIYLDWVLHHGIQTPAKTK